MNTLTRMLVSSGFLENLANVKREIEMEIGENLFEYSVVNTDDVRDELLDELKNCIPEKEIDMIIEEDLEMFQLFNIDVSVQGIREANIFWTWEDYLLTIEETLCHNLGKILANDKELLADFVDELLKHYEENDKLGLPF